MTTAVSGPSLPRVRHGFLAAALLAVAALRLSLGDLVWAGVLAAAGLVEVYVAYASARRATETPAAAAAPVALPRADQLDRTLLRQRQGQQLWTGLLVAMRRRRRTGGDRRARAGDRARLPRARLPVPGAARPPQRDGGPAAAGPCARWHAGGSGAAPTDTT